MENIMLCGINGNMGRKIYERLINLGHNVACGIDKTLGGQFDCPIYKDFYEVRESIDFVIDFSSSKLFDKVLDFAYVNKVPLICGTTGLNAAQIERAHKLADTVPVFLSSNMAVGVNLFTTCAQILSKNLIDNQIAIIETHHNGKKDLPSGTALDIKKAIESVTDSKAEICSIRGGSVIGEHKVVFLGQNQTITITHTAIDRSLFVDGVINALDFLKDKDSGFYTTKDLINL